MSHYDETRNRFNPCNRFIGDIENGLRYPFACYTKEESDERYARKTTETDLAELEALVNTKASQTDLNAFEAQTNNSIAAIQSQLDDILQRLDALEFKSISIQSFTASPNLIELGSNSTITLNWIINKAATTQTINGEDVIGTTKQYANVSATTNYTLYVSDGNTTANKTITVNAANQIYYGVAADLSDVTALTKVLSDEVERTITVNAGAGQYIIYAYPARLGNVEFWVENFEGGFEPAVELNVTNASGYTELYKIYRSTNPNLGSTTVEIKEV